MLTVTEVALNPDLRLARVYGRSRAPRPTRRRKRPRSPGSRSRRASARGRGRPPAEPALRTERPPVPARRERGQDRARSRRCSRTTRSDPVDGGGRGGAGACADDVLLTCHLGPDGDAVGSMTAIAALLVERWPQGRRSTTPTACRGTCASCRAPTRVVRSLPAAARFEAAIVRRLRRPRAARDALPRRGRDRAALVLDHHATSKPFGRYLCLVDAASVGVVVARLRRAPRLADLSRRRARHLHLDCLGHRVVPLLEHQRRGAQLAAACVAAGVDPWHVARTLGEESPLARYKLLGVALGTIALEVGGRRRESSSSPTRWSARPGPPGARRGPRQLRARHRGRRDAAS